jgi:hypothetical protein
MSDIFEGSHGQYERLRSALVQLVKHIAVKEILSESKAGVDRSTLGRFINQKTEKLNQLAAERLWNYIQKKYPMALISPSNLSDDLPIEDRFFVSSQNFYRIRPPRIETFGRKYEGFYQLFVRSEIFYNERKVVLGLWHFRRSENGALLMTEVQKHRSDDLGNMEESYTGVCIPKSDREIFLLRKNGYENIPKFCFVDDHHANQYDNKVDWATGFIVKPSSKFGIYFQTNFFARRISRKEEAIFDIVDESWIDNAKYRHIHNWVFK